MKKISLSIVFLLLSLASTTKAQSVIAVQIEQHPPLGVVADNVQVEMPAGGMTLGSSVSVNGGDGTYTYSWTNANGDVLGTEPTLAITKEGDYYLAVTDASGCTVSVKFTASNSTGIESLQQGPFSLTATDGTLNIVSIKPLRNVRIVAANGQLVANTKLSTATKYASLSTASFSSGVYLVGCVFDDNTETVKKITIK
ncbi:T9SS type A sorting domain-containing protein [Prevotella sp.]|uniref:T9SS type A sorting domain-containing protein n=1 Tax=Prevotella sp. TaxID=59823 RepID=UPI0030768B34